MSQTKAQLVGGVGISTAENVVVGSAVTINSTGINVVGVVTATSFSGDGSGLSNTGSTLSAASGSQRVVVTTQTSGTMTASATDGGLTYDANSDTLNTANLHVTGISTLGSANGIGKVTIGIGTTALLVEGNARVTGILTVGTGSILLNGNTDVITVGTGATITGSGNVNVSGMITGSTGCIRGTFTGSTICATTGFSGSGANITGIPASNITGLSGGGGAQTFSSPGTFPVPPGTSTLKITAIGGGGNGCPSACVNPPGWNGDGGGASALQVKYLSVPPSCSSYPVTIGGAGGDTIFGGPTVFLVSGAPSPAFNGKPAQADYVVLTEGGCRRVCGSGVDYQTASMRYGCGYERFAPSPTAIFGGAGSPSYFGRGGDGAFATGFIPTCSLIPACPGCGYGAGGGGAASGSPTNCTGATGSPGFMIVEW